MSRAKMVTPGQPAAADRIPASISQSKDPYYRIGIPTPAKPRAPIRSASPWNSDMITLLVFQGGILIFLLVVVYFLFR